MSFCDVLLVLLLSAPRFCSHVSQWLWTSSWPRDTNYIWHWEWWCQFSEWLFKLPEFDLFDIFLVRKHVERTSTHFTFCWKHNDVLYQTRSRPFQFYKFYYKYQLNLISRVSQLSELFFFFLICSLPQVCLLLLVCLWHTEFPLEQGLFIK